jgi:hypothetical protein
MADDNPPIPAGWIRISVQVGEMAFRSEKARRDRSRRDKEWLCALWPHNVALRQQQLFLMSITLRCNIAGRMSLFLRTIAI